MAVLRPSLRSRILLRWNKVLSFSILLGIVILLIEAKGVPQNGSAPNMVPERISRAILTLSHVPAGKVLLARAQKAWDATEYEDLLERFKLGKVSRTDTVLTRRYNPHTGSEERERQITIYLRQDQPQLELILDMAHELVHAIAKPTFDPYDSSLTPAKYILSAIEGEGGEVDAVLKECEIAFQLAKRLKSANIQRCSNYGLKDYLANSASSAVTAGTPAANRMLASAAKGLGGLGKVSVARPNSAQAAEEEGPELTKIREAIKEDFYHVGGWLKQLKEQLGEDISSLPLLSSEKPKLYSSTGHAPYPVALLKEYSEINEIACKNSRKRMTSVSAWDPRKDEGSNGRTAIQKFLEKRCYSEQKEN